MPFAPLLLAAHLIAQAPAPAAPPPPPTATRAQYEAERDRAGRDAASQVKLALWCEAHGLTAERLKHLAQAALRGPGDAAARGLMGIVRFGDAWARPEKVAAQVGADAGLQAKLADYHERRDRAAMTADGQVALARWCEEAGLADEARAHHAVALRFDPDRGVSRRRLGYRRDGRRWVTDEQLAAEREEGRRQEEATRRWKAKLTEWRGWLDERGERRAKAEAGLASVDDPRAVPAILQVFGRGSARDRSRAVSMLGLLDTIQSSRSLVAFAVADREPEIRRVATEHLKRRDLREYADLLVGSIREPLEYEVRPVGGTSQPGTLLIRSRAQAVQRFYVPEEYRFGFQPGDYLFSDETGELIIRRNVYRSTSFGARITGEQMVQQYGLQASNRAIAGFQQKVQGQPLTPISTRQDLANRLVDYQETSRMAWMGPRVQELVDSTAALAQRPTSDIGFAFAQETQIDAMIPARQIVDESRRSAAVSAQQLEADVLQIEATNRAIREANAPILAILDSVSNQHFGDQPALWQGWYIDQIGYQSRPEQTTYPPTLVEVIPSAYQPEPLTPLLVTGQWSTVVRRSCFGAGTPVRTLSGPVPIEKLRVGDRVLTSGERTGALAYHPVTVVHHNPPSPTFLVKVKGDAIVSSPFHRFWVRGRGWVMARDLVGGEELRLLGGTARVDSVEAGPVQPVFNLDVAGDHDFFAGVAAALVHDNSLPDTRLVPFDAVAVDASAPAP